MPWSGYTGSEAELAKSAQSYFNRIYDKPRFKKAEQIDKRITWKPSLHFNGIKHEIIAVEASEVPYPAIFKHILADLVNIEMPIVAYCICPEDAYLHKPNQSEIKSLKQHGYGLLTVDGDGDVNKRHGGIPLIQHISDDMFEDEIRSLPKSIKVRLRESFETYKGNASAGMANITEVAEGVVLDAGKKLANNSHIPNRLATKAALNALLDEMLKCPQCVGCKASIAGMMSYISTYRNTSHHTPKSRKQEYRKYRDCKHGFLEGIKQIKNLRESFKISLNYNVCVLKLT